MPSLAGILTGSWQHYENRHGRPASLRLASRIGPSEGKVLSGTEGGPIASIIGNYLHNATYGDLPSSDRCKLMRSEGHLEYPFQSKTLATRGASEGKVVDLSYFAKGR